MNECITTPQHKNKSAIRCQTNSIYIKSKNHIYIYIYVKNSLGHEQSVKIIEDRYIIIDWVLMDMCSC